MIKNIVEYIVKNLVEMPEDVVVSIEDLDHKIMITIQVSPDDLKRVIGREGRVVRAIQAFVAANHTTQGIDVVVNSTQR